MNGLISRNVSRSLTMVCRRALATTPKTGGSFKVQDDKDFVDKVENSKEPVIVDFFATYVVQKLLNHALPSTN